MPTFAVATKAIILDGNNRVLLLHKSDLEDINPNTVDIPGGRLEFKEKPVEGIIREVREETGLDIEVITPSNTWTLVKEEEEFQLTGITFLCKLKGAADIIISEEHTLAEWFSIDEILNDDYPDWIKEEVIAAQKVAININ